VSLFRTWEVDAGPLVLLLAILLAGGCRDEGPRSERRGPATETDTRGGLFDSVAENLDHLEQFDTDQVLRQIGERLNQWYLQDRPEVAWREDPLVKTLSEELRNQPDVKKLGAIQFQIPDDGWFLQEAVWLRDISKQARADQFQDQEVAKRLFDWTVRNIQLEPDGKPGAIRHRPFETILYGRGTAIERAWVFLLLARQQGLNVVMLGIADADGKNVRPWLPALVLDGQLYLYDTRLGLPIPGAEPSSVATLAQVVEDDGLLRKLDLDAEHPYWVKADDLKHVVALVEGSPASLSRRMALVESRLAGKAKMRLVAQPGTLAEEIKKLPHVTDVRLWPLPFEVALDKARRTPAEEQAAANEMVLFKAFPELKVGRALQFKGQYEGEPGAKTSFLNARAPDEFINNYRLPPEYAQRIPRERWAEVEAIQVLRLQAAKQAASHWLGLIFFEQQDYPSSIDFLAKRALADEKTPWKSSSRYNLARAYEANGDNEQAIKQYEADAEGPQGHGNQLRAKWLKGEEKPAEEAPEKPAEEKPADQSTEEPAAPE